METQVKEYEGERVQEPQAPAHPLALAPSHSESPKEESIELRSEGVQELMGRIPSWTVRYGISVIALVVVLLLGLAALIRWPDVVAGTIRRARWWHGRPGAWWPFTSKTGRTWWPAIRWR